MLIKCKYCDKEFEASNRKINEAKKKDAPLFCSKECFNKQRNTKIKCTCAKCGKEILKNPSELKNSVHGNVFCNKSCACSFNNSKFRLLGNNPNWKGTFPSGINYSRIAYRNYISKCAICNFDKFPCLEVHHIDKNRNNNELDNLIILCANCHCLVHYDNLQITEQIKNNRELVSG